MNRSEQRHEKVVDGLVKRLKETGQYKWIEPHVEYFDGQRIVGECDVWAKRLHSDRYVAFEVKGHYCPRSYTRAKSQLHRTVDYLPGLTVIPVFVSPEKTKRYYPQVTMPPSNPPTQLELDLCDRCDE